MKRIISILLLCSACAGLVWATWTKGRELGDLRQREESLLAGASQAEPDAQSVNNTQTAPQAEGVTNGSELLQLRAEVHRLENKKRELTAVVAENQGLKVQLASMATNLTPELPPDYIRRLKAQDRGFATPQATLETFLWAGQNTNLDRFLKCFPSERAEQLQSLGGSQHYMGSAGNLPGFRIARTNPSGPDSLTAQIEVIPGVAYPSVIGFKLINGEWKIVSF